MAESYVNISPALIEEQRRAFESEKTAFKPRVEFNEKNYLSLRVGPGDKEKVVTVRILPISATDGNAFFTIHTHSLKVNQEISKSGFKSFICLNDPNLHSDDENEHHKCPLCEKSREIFKMADACTDEIERKALIKEASQYRSKRTFIVRVIDRAHEDEGVKFWRFNEHRDGKGYYDQLMDLYKIRNNESVNAGHGEFNIFDLKNGKDIVITLKYDPMTKKTTSTITDSGFITPLSTSEEKILEWVNDPKTWRDLYASKSYEYLKIVADGEIPFYDKDKGGWVAKASKDSQQSSVVPEPIVTAPQVQSYTEEEEELPF